MAQHFFNSFKKNEAALHELSYLFWECTTRCNLNCIHCGSDCKSDSKTVDMPFEDFLNAILPLRKVYKRDSIIIAITGGEAILRKDLVDCCKTLRQNGFRFGLVTNGYGYTADMHSKLLDAGMDSITLSLDGLEESHNWLRQNDKSFDRAVNALKIIASSKTLVYDVITCVNKRNINELEKLKDFIISQNLSAWRFFTISPIGRAVNNEELYLTDTQLKYLMDFIVKVRAEKRIQASFSCESYLGEYEKKVRDEYFFCRAGIHIASILIDGSISACPNIDRTFSQGNIYKDDFLDVWNNRFKIMRDRRWTRKGLCLNCKDYKNCSGGSLHLWNEKRDTIMTCLHKRIMAANTS
ncbi:MAG: TIGR04133 family radical SAM/SPASM protein [Treponema sp.]|nr:TIGR04133 family radical SAM/SPASM protein [Treponema sp.]